MAYLNDLLYARHSADSTDSDMAHEPVLIVDDNPSNVKLARLLLENAGYDVRTAGDSEEARHRQNDPRQTYPIAE